MSSAAGLVVIGGSWGGIQASLAILKSLPANYRLPIVLVLHRLRNAESDLESIYEKKLALQVQEVDEKDEIRPGHLYLAPPNYHVLIEKDKTFSLDVSDFENYSRPSIDVTFTSAADALGSHVIGILLSGASKDGSAGLKHIRDKGGQIIVQDPEEAEADTMPREAIRLIPDCTIMNLERISAFLLNLT